MMTWGVRREVVSPLAVAGGLEDMIILSMILRRGGWVHKALVNDVIAMLLQAECLNVCSVGV